MQAYIYIILKLDAIAKKVLIKVQSSKLQEDKMFQKTSANNGEYVFIIGSSSLAYPYRAISF